MASFTDIIPQFNPYVQQLPVEAMVQVGMEKQKRYDEGIQKIQSQIDEIGGMDIYKPVHRMYLQSKLNELGNNLKGVAAGDFSNFQLVNSVGGMISQVVKDPVVKNAYESTQLLRKQQGYMEEAKRNGKSSPENEWWFMGQIDNWQSDPDLLRKFTGEYIEYRDVDKKLRDVASKIKEMEQSVDIPYQRNADGSYRLDEDGNPMVDDAMLRIKVKGTPAEKILNNFYSSLDENDKRQLMITGNYHYRNATKPTFQNDIISTYDAQKRELGNQLSKLAVELKTNDKLTSAQIAEMEAAINRGVEKINSGYFEKEATKKIDEIDKVTDLQDFKYRLYTQKYLTGLSQDLSNQSYTQEILSNPYAQMNMEKKKLEFSVQRAKVQDAQFWASHNLNVDKFEWEKKVKREEQEGLKPIVTYGGLGTDVKLPSLGDVEKNIGDTKSTMLNLDSKYGNMLFPELKGASQKKALDDLVDKYITNPTSITDNDERSYVEQMRGLQITLARQNGLMNSTLEHTQGYRQRVSDVFKGTQGILNKNGEEVYSAEELYSVNNRINANATGTRAGTIIYDKNEIYKGLSPKLKILAGTLLKAKEGRGEFLTSPNTATSYERSILNRADQIVNTFKPKVATIFGEKLKAEGQFLAARMPEVQTTFGTLNMENKNTNERVKNLIGNATKAYDELGASDQENLKDFNPDTITSWRSGEGAKELRYVVEKNFDGSGKLIIYKGTEKQTIPMTSRDVADYFPDVAERSFMTDVKYQVLSSPGKTTNAVKRNDPVNAAYSGFNIPSLSSSGYGAITRLDIEGGPDNNGGENDVFQVRMYVYDKGVWKNSILNQQGYVGAAGVEEIMNAIGPATAEEIRRKK